METSSSGAEGYREMVSAVAKKVGLLSPQGTLMRVDSLSLLDFVVELENAFGRRIDIDLLEPESFESLESVCAMLAQATRAS